MVAESRRTVSDWFHQTAEATEIMLGLTAKCQVESMEWWAALMSGSGSVEEWQKRARRLLAEESSAARTRVEEHLRALDRAYQQGMELLRTGIETHGFQSMKDLQSRTQTLWENTLGALRVNTRNFAEANRRAMESWAELVRDKRESTPDRLSFMNDDSAERDGSLCTRPG